MALSADHSSSVLVGQAGPTAALRAQVYGGFNSWELFGQIDALAADIVASIRLVTVSDRMSSSWTG